MAFIRNVFFLFMLFLMGIVGDLIVLIVAFVILDFVVFIDFRSELLQLGGGLASFGAHLGLDPRRSVLGRLGLGSSGALGLAPLALVKTPRREGTTSTLASRQRPRAQSAAS